MLFNTTRFFVFLVLVVALFYALPRRFRKYLLLAASYFFYGSWNPKFIPLLLSLTAIDFTAGIWLERTNAPSRRRAILIGSLACNLGFLGFFKYYNFLASNLALALGGPPRSYWLDIVLPLGISFHTFQSISYVVDVYRREQKAIRNPVDYALFIAFFPQLVAGPIVRARNFFGDLYHWKPPSADDVSRGIFLMALGLTKKMAFADQFAVVANSYFNDVAAHPGRITAWSGAFAFAMQIYFDFSGYTDMAIGMAKLLGFHFPINFRRPYLARGIADFWRRWHISLSTWLRDYLYIPLGGNRRGRWMTYRNLMLTMLLGGLWHGASWNFLIWGGYHGGFAERRTRPPRLPQAAVRIRLARSGANLSNVWAGNGGVGILPRRRFAAECSRDWADARGCAWKEFAATLANWSGGSCAGDCSGRRAVGGGRAFDDGAGLGLRGSSGGNAILPGGFRRDRFRHSFHLFPVLRDQ